MGKLNIAHHKSYHPYRRDNIEKVRKDEEDARLKEEQEEQRMMLADSEARMDVLRKRAGITEQAQRPQVKDETDRTSSAVVPVASSSSTSSSTSLTTTSGHINFFAEFDSAIALQQAAEKKGKPKEEDKGTSLAPSAHDLNPWYADRDLRSLKEKEREKEEASAEQRRKRDASMKRSADPLTSMNGYLARRSQLLGEDSRSRPKSVSRPNVSMPPPSHSSGDARDSRVKRESSERARAEELIRRRRREMEGTDSSVGGDTPREYSDQFYRKETREAGERRRERDWDGRSRDRDRWRSR